MASAEQLAGFGILQNFQSAITETPKLQILCEIFAAESLDRVAHGCVLLPIAEEELSACGPLHQRLSFLAAKKCSALAQQHRALLPRTREELVEREELFAIECVETELQFLNRREHSPRPHTDQFVLRGLGAQVLVAELDHLSSNRCLFGLVIVRAFVVLVLGAILRQREGPLEALLIDSELFPQRGADLFQFPKSGMFHSQQPRKRRPLFLRCPSQKIDDGQHRLLF